MLRRLGRSIPAAEPIVVHAVNEQHDLPMDIDLWRKLVADVLVAESVSGPGEANLVFVDTVAMAALNQLHMGVNGPTDVLSFPIDAADDLGDAELRIVGDVVICPAVAADNAPQHAGTYLDEVALLLVHGSLHLLGYDHAADDERQRMWKREHELLGRFYGPLARDPWVAA